jgi:hypothetical protein
MLRLTAGFVTCGIGAPIVVLTVPRLYRLFSDWPELILAIWPTSLILMADKGLAGSMVAVASNGALYASIGVTVCLLFGGSGRKPAHLQLESSEGARRRIHRSSILALSFSALLLLPVTLVCFLNAPILVQCAQLLGIIVAAVRVRSRAVYPFAFLFTEARQDYLNRPSLVEAKRMLDMAKRSRLIPVTSTWLMVTAGVLLVSPAERGMLPPTDLGWLAPTLWVPTAIGFALASTAALLWLTFHVHALRR